MQRDPLGYVDGMNSHEYATSRPSRHIDSFGTKKHNGINVKSSPGSDSDDGKTSYETGTADYGEGEREACTGSEGCGGYQSKHKKKIKKLEDEVNELLDAAHKLGAKVKVNK